MATALMPAPGQLAARRLLLFFSRCPPPAAILLPANFARARGLKDRTVNFRHALKNTLVPVITVTGLQLGSIIAFAIITETVFQWPGVGLLFINAVYFVDIPVMSAYLLLVGVLFVLINLAVDLLYLAIDPRLRDSQLSGEA